MHNYKGHPVYMTCIPICFDPGGPHYNVSKNGIPMTNGLESPALSAIGLLVVVVLAVVVVAEVVVGDLVPFLE